MFVRYITLAVNKACYVVALKLLTSLAYFASDDTFWLCVVNQVEL